MEPSQSPAPLAGYRPADSLGVLRHRWWVVGLALLLGAAAGAAWLQVQEPVWEATTSVLVHPAGHDTNVVGGRTQGQVNLDTEAQLVRSTAVAAGAAELLAKATAGPPGATPEDAAARPEDAAARPEDLARQVSVAVPPNTSVLLITFAAGTPHQAQAGSHAFAEAYLEHREHAARADLAGQINTIETKIEELNASLADINERMAEALPETAAAANLESRRGTVTNQLSTMTGRLDELTTATVTAGTIISEARLPARPSRPQPAVVLASGTALGLVAGLGIAGLTERLARRIHRPGDVTRRLGLPVLAALGPAMVPGDEIASPYGPGGRAFDRLRNEVIASEQPRGAGRPHGAPPAGHVLVVTSASAGASSSLTATNLAASLARSGHEVILVGAQAAPEPGGNTLPQLLGVAAAPGLSEVLAGRVPVARALQRSPRHPRLRAMPMGATATATGLLQSPALRASLTALAGTARYVVVAAPPTSASADAQSLASHADAALLVVERRRDRLAGVADAIDQLRRVGTPLLGAVVVPPRADRQPADPEADSPEADSPEADSPDVTSPETGNRETGSHEAADQEAGHEPDGTARVRPANGRPSPSPSPVPGAWPAPGAGLGGGAGRDDSPTLVMPCLASDGDSAREPGGNGAVTA